MNRLVKASMILGGAALANVLGTSTAEACGGFFCSQINPVDQTSERIIFSHNGDGTITTAIQIQYQGPSESFAWVLPVPGLPEVSVSSDSAFSLLQRMTDPQYNLEQQIEGECKAPEQVYYADGATAGFGGATAAPVAETANADPVVVVGEGGVGPYDWVVISVVPDAEDTVQVALDWLAENGYDVTALGPEVLRPYLDSGMNLLAFKLTKDSDVGSIRPVMLTYESDVPMIPIRPTAVAATEDMGIMTWVLGEAQAIPSNYLSLVLNDALINWFNWRQNYDDVVSMAADESGGQGFVTEFGGKTEFLDQLVFTDQNAQDWEQVSTMDYATGYDAIDFAQRYYRSWDGWRDAIEAATTLPEGVTLDEFGRNPTAYRDNPDLVIDTEVFLDKLKTLVVEPMQKTQELLDARPYMTRLYTTMSPNEMTDDPAFDFNADLVDVNNVHRATQIISCNKDLYVYEAPFVIDIPGFGTVEGDPNNQYIWPIGLTEMPATRKIVDLGTTGSGDVLIDNSQEIFQNLGSVMVENPQAMEMQTGDLVPIGGVDDMVPMMTPPAPDDSTQQASSGTGSSDPGASNSTPDTTTEPVDVNTDSNDSSDPVVDDNSSDAVNTDEMNPADTATGENKSSGGGCSVAAHSQSGMSWAWLVALGLPLLRRRRAAKAR